MITRKLALFSAGMIPSNLELVVHPHLVAEDGLRDLDVEPDQLPRLVAVLERLVRDVRPDTDRLLAPTATARTAGQRRDTACTQCGDVLPATGCLFV